MKDSNNDTGNFFDSRTIFAMLLVVATFIGWQMHMKAKYPNLGKKPAATKAETPAAGATTGTSSVSPETAANPSDTTNAAGTAAQNSASPETFVHFDSADLAFDISSKGMGLKNLQILKYKDRGGKVIDFGHPDNRVLPYETRLSGHGEALDFQIETVNPNMFIGRAHVGGLEVTKTMEIKPDAYTINFKVSASGQTEGFAGLSTFLTEQLEPVKGGGFLMPQFQKQELYIEAVDSHERLIVKKENVEKSWNRVKLASVGSQYFTQALLDTSSVMPEAKVQIDHAKQSLEMNLTYPVLAKAENFTLTYTGFVGPKSYALLHSIDPDLAKVVDFGFFNWIGKHILELLKWFYAVVGNWGVAIILLTIVVRGMVLPINMYSYKSMKSMQAIQPQIQAMREKHKDDQQKQQQEMMSLMREHKVNPVGGCLPVLLQFPIFIALYQVLGNSIELYQAPFGLWIHDLSSKDPYYILPVLMGITMFIQQKTMPNPSMDPAQAKVLMLMPILFSFFMLSLPSGLTLYMLVGALCSIAQQKYFMRNSTTPSRVSK